ncbi:14243_t:CDS:2 [Dentiscutata erythropus]|uniref:14243_t:CDS:1 n=1 Tax=Dentiscutata erythropus TaxID=1348616 RepID=A0A9N9P1K7_9GLOM|nr:14243_t:CDS:2 [Dentiscutata erythropus]
MYIWHIFIFITSTLLIVNALPYKSPKPYTITLKKKLISKAHILHYVSRPSTTTDIKRAATEPLKNEFHQDYAYFGEVTLSGQKFNVMIDTGFGDFLIPSINCTSSACKNKSKYNPVNDKSFKTKNKTFGYVYFGGNVYGIRSTASLNINGYTPGYSSGQNFGLVNILPESFKNDEFDGILGLAASNEFVKFEYNVYENILLNYETENAIFSLMIGREADETESELIIGGIDQSKYTGELVTTQMSDNIYWSIHLDGFSINGKSLEFQGRIGKIVSGISPIIVPFDDAHKIYQKIPNAIDNDGSFVMPCESEFKVKIKIGSVDWDIDPRDLIDVQQLRNQETCSGMIMGGITASDNEWILGTTFLKNVYSVYDYYDHAIRFAKLNDSKFQ